MQKLKPGRKAVLFIGLFLSIVCSLNAQVLVHQEPKHHLVFESKQIRILDVIMAPGDSSVYHIHHTPSFFIMFTSTETGSMLKGGEPSQGKNTAGTMFYENLSAPNTRTHRVWNLDKDTFHVMDIELLGKDSGYALPPVVAPGLVKEIDTAWSRAYRLTLAKGQEFKLNEKKRAFILVSYGRTSVETTVNGMAEVRELKEGGFVEVRKGKNFALKNRGEQPIEFAVLELPHQ